MASSLVNAFFLLLFGLGLSMAGVFTYVAFFDVSSDLYALSFDAKLFPYLLTAIWLYCVWEFRRRILMLFKPSSEE